MARQGYPGVLANLQPAVNYGQPRWPGATQHGSMRHPVRSSNPAHYRHTTRTGEPIAGLSRLCKSLLINHFPSRDGRIRTGDPLNPIQVRYRAAPRPVEEQR
jgi:hypothetical protein